MISNRKRLIAFLSILILAAVTVFCSNAYTYEAKSLHPGSLPEIYGDDVFKSKINQSLGFLNEFYPDNATSVKLWLSEIRPTDTYTRVNSDGICFIDNDDADASAGWLASVLIHEAKHVEDDTIYFIDHRYSDEESEERALSCQAAFIGSIKGWSEEKKNDWINQWLDKQYWVTIPAEYN